MGCAFQNALLLALHLPGGGSARCHSVPYLLPDDFEKITPEQGLEATEITSAAAVHILEFEVNDPMSLKCAAFSATVEASGTLGHFQGSAVTCPVTRSSPVGNSLVCKRWFGRAHAFWSRWESWLRAQTVCKRHAFWSRWESWLGAQTTPPTQVMLDVLSYCEDEQWKFACWAWGIGGNLAQPFPLCNPFRSMPRKKRRRPEKPAVPRMGCWSGESALRSGS